MRKLLFLALIGLFFSGCGTTAQQSEFAKHKSMYVNWDHMMYSWFGYKNPTPDTLKKSSEQGWWGIPTPGEK